jgi:Right handed beta helix region
VRLPSILLLATAIFAALPGCGSSGDDTAPGPVDPPPAPPVEKPCNDSFTPMAGEAGCAPIHVQSACAAGTRAALGAAACVPVGVTACAAGFEKDASGWGCDAIIAPVACPSGSGTRERLGLKTCVPVSDCSAPFPPAGATLLVDAAFADAQLDATHFRTIGEAVAIATAGATVAVEAGAYAEKIALKKRAVTIAGRCAEKVIVTQAAGATGSAIDVAVGDDVLLKNLTFRGHNRSTFSIEGGKTRLDSVVIEDGLNAGITAVNAGTDVHLKNVVIRGITTTTQQAFGVFATGDANVVIEDSVFASNQFVNVGVARSAKLSMSRSIVRDGQTLSRNYGLGVYVGESGGVVIEESAIVENSADGLDVFGNEGDTGTAVLRRSVVRGTKLAPGMGIGRGVESSNSHVTIEQSTIRGNAQVEVFASTGSLLDISDTTILGLPPTDAKDRGVLGLVTDSGTTKARSVAIVSSRTGAEVQGPGRLEMDGSLVHGTRASETVYEDGAWIGLGITVESKSSLLLTRSTIQDTRTVGVLVTGKAEINDTLVRGTRGGLDGFGGRGLSVQNGGTVTVGRSAFVDNRETGVIVMLGGSSLTMSESTVQDTGLDPQGNYGIGLLLGDDALALVEGCTITGSKGVGLAVAAAGASFHKGTISKNAIGVHAQGGTALMEGDTDGDPRTLMISKDTRFVDNTTRVGSGVVPLPPPVLGPRTR